MHWIDYAIIAIVMISALVGGMRGIMRELLSFMIWMLALAVAWLLHREVADLLTTQFAQPSLRMAIAFIGLLFISLILGSILSVLLTAFINRIGLTRVDHALGLVFGMLRGLIIVAMLVFLAALTPLPTASWWQESSVINHLQTSANWFVSQTPANLRAWIKQL